jgi:phospholipid/cholesterol/gamma-HCH transport system permease protein
MLILLQPFYHFGRYCLMLKNTFSKPEKGWMYWRETLRQMISMGIGSLGIVVVQTAYQLVSPIIPVYVVAEIVRDSSILELSVTVICLVLAGKIGSNLASELGTMRITEQIDALEIMGVNSKAYLILPKVLGAFIAIPALVIVSCFVTILGGYVITFFTHILTPEQYLYGLHDKFVGFNVVFCLIKAFTFAFVISSISCYCGYFTDGGAFELGKSSTNAVVWSCIFVLVLDYVLAQLIL